MNLVNIVQQYNKLLIFDDFIKYKYDQRTRRKYHLKSKSHNNNNINNNIIPILQQNNSNITENILKQSCFIKQKQFSKPINIDINNINNNKNNNNKENEEGIVTTSEALEHPLLNRQKPSEIKPPKYIITAKPSAKKRCLSSIPFQQNKLESNNDNHNNNNKCMFQNNSCKNINKNNKYNYNENEQILNLFPNPNLFSKKNILSKALRYSVNNVPYVKVGIFGRVSNKEGIKVDVVPPFYNRKMKEELYEYNERVVPMLKVGKIIEQENEGNQMERYKIQELLRSDFDPQEFYFVTKPFMPTLRGMLKRNSLTAKKYNVVRGICENGKIEIVDNSDNNM